MRIERSIKLGDSQMKICFIHNGEKLSYVSSSVSLEELIRSYLITDAYEIECSGPVSILVGKTIFNTSLYICIEVSWDIEDYFSPFLKLNINARNHNLSIIQVYDGPDEFGLLWKLGL